MKISFSTPLLFTDGSTIPTAALAQATYTVYIDTVNPPVKSYTVPTANVAAATTNADGSKQVTLQATDVGVAVAPNVTYYVDTADSVSGNPSAQTSVLTYKYSPVPNSPGNFSLA